MNVFKYYFYSIADDAAKLLKAAWPVFGIWSQRTSEVLRNVFT
ncbi:hypothetical protein CPter91_5398 [Collimonas pratensis]|uniref:Uncharacterized protein n=1 Tax=Collimonas pratensis TaxID=279113 RepID=A0A127QCD2_9BURK|nr:hypothetical protein CPter91_5398 [Collimonas pratensis]